MTHHHPEEPDALARARQAGAEAARLADLRLLEVEAAEREERLAVHAWRPRPSEALSAGSDDSVKLVQLEARVSELNAYVKAVNESRPWRLIQWCRRLLGRSW